MSTTAPRAGVRRADRWPRTSTWLAACVAAETIGMTAASSAAVVAGHLGDTRRDQALALAVIVAGGLVEGAALGTFQSTLLRRVLGARTTGWVVATVVVAGLGWAAASAPGVLADDSADGPSRWLMILGGAGLGVVMGAVLGAAQALSLRGAVSHPWRWVAISALAWVPVMAVIFAGASTPTDSWTDWETIAIGVLTGMLAGAVLGGVSGPLLPRLDDS